MYKKGPNDVLKVVNCLDLDVVLITLTDSPQSPFRQSFLTKAPMIITTDSLMSGLPIFPFEISYRKINYEFLSQGENKSPC